MISLESNSWPTDLKPNVLTVIMTKGDFVVEGLWIFVDGEGSVPPTVGDGLTSWHIDAFLHISHVPVVAYMTVSYRDNAPRLDLNRRLFASIYAVK